ncbi:MULTISPECIES: ABC transporter permease [unclassified Plantactinospora]|uniref:ABC transporter permease n=1 Tax=unclassified Plantactinospora TaxID=2631981 RepID=UPI000D158D9E|nr:MULTISPECIES: ABC transporter permease [unclassified Plantactinospora]AVT32510.1 ABC transporter [Plantactinospora sp. BC1]AVT39188.1 ABC transporter [Plantactinospora sp. BB1]
MNPTVVALRAGVRRGWIEVRQSFVSVQDLWNYFFPNVSFLVVMFFMRDATVPGTNFSLGARTLPSVLGGGLAFGALVTMMMALTVEREDGTLLRAKAIPNGMLGHLVGKVVLVSGMALVSSVILVVPGVFLVDGVALRGPGAWLTLLWVLVLGLVACLPLGAILGSLFDNPRNVGVIMLPIMGLVATSGIFYPITSFPVWLQWIGQAFPVYWLGLGTRSALLPPELAAVEIGGSWRHLETFGMLAGWAVLGLVVAPIVLRRMARRESGSSVAARKEKAMQRIN